MGVSSISVTGGGVIDGSFSSYIGGFIPLEDKYITNGWPDCVGECRPRLVQFISSTNITVNNITLMNSPDWTFHLLNCSYVSVNQLTQYGDPRWPK
jgi:polygalacturonase